MISKLAKVTPAILAILNIVYLSKHHLFYPLFFIGFVACANVPNLQERKETANQISATNQLKFKLVKTKEFNLASFYKIQDINRPLNIYIEGDGYAWQNNSHSSNNPTPINPVSLRMAAVDSGPNILYIARPCQYVDLNNEKNCQEKFWTNWRFSMLVVNSINQVIDYFLNEYQLNAVNLYGHSGGAALALLIASQRSDVKSIKTVAGNLNPQLLNQIQGVSPLNGSLNPIDYLENIKAIPQLHIAGAKDIIVLPEVIADFVDKVKNQGGVVEMKLINEADHEYQKWPQIWRENLI